MVNDHERNTKKTKQPTLTINDIRDMGLTCRLQGKEFIKYDGLDCSSFQRLFQVQGVLLKLMEIQH